MEKLVIFHSEIPGIDELLEGFLVNVFDVHY